MGKHFETPILYVVFNRLASVKKTFPEIAKQKPKRLFIAADGPRDDEERKKTDAVRKYILNSIDWKCDVETRFLDKNVGCKNGVSTAIDWFFENVKEGIILEDDCIPDKSFFMYCQELLERYRNNDKVMTISGTNPLERVDIKESYYFVRSFDCWGWATWQNVWESRDVTSQDYLRDKKSGKFKENIKNYVDRMLVKKRLEDNLADKVGGWDQPIIYLQIKKKGVCIKPRVNLIQNIGFTGDSTHTSENFIDIKFYCVKKFNMDFPLVHPKIIEVNQKLSSRELRKDVLRVLMKKIFWFAV